MIENLAHNARPILNIPFVRRTRRNHGLEHATVHVLSSRIRPLAVAGRSDDAGFWLIGDLQPEQVQEAAHEALRRMRAGEHQLAIHPNCGTSLLTTGTLVGLAALVGSVGVRRGALDYLSRLPSVIALSLVAIVFSRPLGLQIQEHFTTLGDPGDLEIVLITRKTMTLPIGRELIMHRVDTRSS